MVFHSQNHPSVVIFGFLNEGHSSQEESKEIYDYLANDVIRKWDLGGRLVSWASSSRFHDVNWDNADFLSFNSYEGWYPTTEAVSVEALQTIPEIWDFSAAWAQDHFPGKPLICSETGAGGIFGMHGPSDGQKWTEEVQSVILQVHTLALTKHEKIAGFSLWQWSDSLIDRNTSDGLHRPRGLNNKGVMTLHRRPKTSFFAMRTIFKNDFWGLILPESDTGKFQDLIKVA
ncbi:unnamed protein product [Amoebophrya sp. A25]|nr:unnamed protein product [Amoebophrya sp. A25]|eukprot:GSA25T00023003001.1